MAPSAVRGRVVGALNKKGGTIKGANPISTLSDLTGADMQSVREALCALRDEGRVYIKYTSDRKVEEVGFKKPRTVDNPDGKSAESRRQGKYATDASGYSLPAHLPDSMVSPVTVRQAKPKFARGDRYAESLTVALRALQAQADESGYADGVSVRKVVTAAFVDATQTQVQTLCKYLREMALYTSDRTGYQTSSYQVDMMTREVSMEMVREYRRSQKEAGKQVTEVSVDETETEDLAVDVESNDVTFEASAESEASEVIEELTSIIESLEATLAERDDEIASLGQQMLERNETIVVLDEARQTITCERDAALGEIASLKERLQAADDKLATAQGELEHRRATSMKAAEVIARYKK